MRIHSVEIENILSIEKATITFKDKGLVLVEGWNYDDNRANGAGKTAMFNAMCFGIYGKVPRKITISEILRRGAKAGKVTVNIEVGSDIYSIERRRPKKVIFYKNKQEIDMNQAEYEAKIGLNYEQFLISMYTAQDYGQKFIDLNDSGKKEFILELMDLAEFARCKREADNKIKDLNEAIANLNTSLVGYKSKIEVYRDQLQDISGLQASLMNLDQVTASANLQINKFLKVQAPDSGLIDSQIQTFQDKLNGLNKLCAVRDIKFSEFKSLRIQSEKHFSPDSGDADCPSCSERLKISGKNLAKISDQTALRQHHDEHIVAIKAQMIPLKKEIDKYDLAIIKIPQFNDKIVALKTKRDLDYKAFNEAQSMVSQLRTLNVKHENEKKNIQFTIDNNAISKNKIKELAILCKEGAGKIAVAKDNLAVLESVSQIYGTTGAQAYVMDTIVDLFNEAVSKHVGVIWPSGSYRLNSYKENKNKDVVAKFSETLIKDGEQCSIGSLSGGEKRAFSLAIDFAIQDVLSKQLGVQLNPTILDEPFNGLDSSGREIVVQLLETISQNRQIYVIDHASEAKAMFKDIVRIEKRKGISNIVL